MRGRRNKNVHAPMVTFIVPGANTALVSTGTALANTTNALGIANNQLGVLSEDFDGTVITNVFKGNQDATNVKAVSIVQGTPNSGQTNMVKPTGVGHKAYVKSGIIRAGQITQVANSRYHPGQYEAEVIENFANLATEINYTMWVDLDSVKRERYFGRHNMDTLDASVTIPSATTNLATYLMTMFAVKLNTKSNVATGNRPFVVLGINTDGTGTGTDIDGLALNNPIPVVTLGGVTYNIVANKALINTLQHAYGWEAAAKIILLDEANADANDKIDALMIVGLDEALADQVDEVSQQKVRVRSTVSYPEGYTSTYDHVSLCPAIEEKNTGRKLLLDFNKRARMQQFSSENIEYLGPILQAPSYINEDGIYNVVMVEFIDGENLITGNSHEPKVVKILMTAADTSVYTVGDDYDIIIGNSQTTVATGLNANFAAWVKSSETYKPVNYSLDYGTESAFF